MQLYVLIRLLSPYTDDDLVLGVFKTEEEALFYKNKYIEVINEQGDMYEKQAYMDVNLEDDMLIRKIECDDIHDKAFCLVGQCEGFGQVCRYVVGLYDTIDKLRDKARALFLKELRANQPFKSAWICNEIPIGSLRFANNDEFVHF